MNSFNSCNSWLKNNLSNLNKQIKHKHYVDFLVGNDILIECKAIEQIGKVFRLKAGVFSF